MNNPAAIVISGVLCLLLAGILWCAAALFGWFPEDDNTGDWFTVREASGYAVERLDGTLKERTVRRP